MAIVPIFVPTLFQNSGTLDSNPAQSPDPWQRYKSHLNLPVSGYLVSPICANPPPASLSTCAGRILACPTREQEHRLAVFKRGEVWWYKFYFAGRLIRESSKSTSKTVAKDAEKQRRRELEAGFHNIADVRQQRIRSLEAIIDEYLVGYRLRNRAPRFAKYALGHVSRLLGNKLSVDVDASAVLCVFGKLALSRIVGLFPRGFAATTSG